MARRRPREGVPVDQVPPELFAPDAPAWASRAAAEAWCVAHGVEPPGSLTVDHAPGDRLATVIPRFAVATGHHAEGRERYPDRAWLAATGLADVAAMCTRAKVDRIKRRAFGHGA